jgi:O-6-methylguanine DNA methyltransferase
VKISFTELATPIGTLVLSAGRNGVTGIEFDTGDPRKTRDKLHSRLTKRFGKSLEMVNSTAMLEEITSWLNRYFKAPAQAGAFTGALDPGGSDFQRSVWKRIANIPPGEVQAYGQLAAAIGKPGAVRAVGSACGANPVPIAVPCHRVVATGGPGGFGGGLDLKRKLLAGEGFLLS